MPAMHEAASVALNVIVPALMSAMIVLTSQYSLSQSDTDEPKSSANVSPLPSATEARLAHERLGADRSLRDAATGTR